MVWLLIENRNDTRWRPVVFVAVVVSTGFARKEGRIPCGLVVMTLAYQMERQWFESAAQQMLLSQKGFEYVTMNPLLPAKAVGPQPTNVPLRSEV